LKNRGIQPLLENVISLLPSPDEREIIEGVEMTTKEKLYRYPNPKDKLCAFAFKVVADPVKGLITFFRIYSGTLKNRSKIINCKLGTTEKITQLFRMTADET
jgi:elongation factor G